MTTHDDLHRDVGRIEGTLDAMEKRMDSLEKTVSDGFKAITERLDRIDARESERKGAFALGHWLFAAATGFIAFVSAYFLKA